MCARILVGKAEGKVTYHLEDLFLHCRVILKGILNHSNVGMLTGSIQLRIRTSRELLWVRWWTFSFRESGKLIDQLGESQHFKKPYTPWCSFPKWKRCVVWLCLSFFVALSLGTYERISHFRETVGRSNYRRSRRCQPCFQQYQHGVMQFSRVWATRAT